MASELYTMNPVGAKKRKKRKTTAKRRPKRRATAAQVAARAKFAAMARGGKKRRRSVAPTKRVSKRRKTRGSRSRGLGLGKINLKQFISLAQTGAMNGAGAFASDLALGFVRPMLPQMLAYGQGRHLTRVAMGMLLGNIVGRMNKKFGDAVTVGAATVAGFDFMKEFVQPMLPAGMVLGEYTDMGYYPQDALGYASPGVVPDMSMGNVNAESGYYSAYN